MAAQDENKEDGGRAKKADERRARLEQALRANLLKRKAKTKAGKPPPAPPEEGGQS